MWYLLIIIGFALTAIDILLHGGHVGFFLVFPFFYGTGGILSIVGIILILIGFFLAPFWFIRKASREYYPPEYEKGISWPSKEYEPEYLKEREEIEEGLYYPGEAQEIEKPKKKTSYGGVIFIGPFPIVFGGGEDKEAVMKWAIIGAIVIGVLMAILVTLYAIFG